MQDWIKFRGRIIDVLPYQSGYRKDGSQWVVCPYVMNWQSQYGATFLYFEMQDSSARHYRIEVGQLVEIEAIVRSVKSNHGERWFTNVLAIRARVIDEEAEQRHREENTDH